MKLVLFAILLTFAGIVKADEPYRGKFGSSEYLNITITLKKGEAVEKIFLIDGVFGNSVNSFDTRWYSTVDTQGTTGFIGSNRSNCGNLYLDPKIERTYSSPGTYFVRAEVFTRDTPWQDFRWKETHQWQISVVVVSDTNPPSNPNSFSGSDPINEWTQDNDLYVKWSGASDGNGFGLDRFHYNWNTSQFYTIGSSDPSLSNTIGSGSRPYNDVHDGKWYFHIRYVDKAGNWATSTKHYGPFQVDRTRPTTPSSIVGPKDDDHITDKTPFFDWNSASDSGSGIKEYEIFAEFKNLIGWWENVSSLNYRKTGGRSSGYTAPEPLTANGTYYRWKVRAWDEAGNVSADWSEIGYFYIDDLPKAGEITGFLNLPSDFRGTTHSVTVKVLNTGRDRNNLIVVPTFPNNSGWTFSPGPPDYQQHNVPYNTENTKDFIFKITPPTKGASSVTVKWELEYDDLGTKDNTLIDEIGLILTSNPIGTIKAWLFDQRGEEAPDAQTKFIIYPTGREITKYNPNSFSEVPVGDGYWVEGHFWNYQWNAYEYWGWDWVSVIPNKTSDAEITRHTPYCEEIWFEYNGEKIDKIPPGATVSAKAKIINSDPDSAQREIRIVASYRYGNSGTGTQICNKSTSIPAGPFQVIDLGDVKLDGSEEGDVSAIIRIYTQFTKELLTDGWDWFKILNVNTGERPKVTSVKIVDYPEAANGSFDEMRGGTWSPGKRYMAIVEMTDADSIEDVQTCTLKLYNTNDDGITISCNLKGQRSPHIWVGDQFVSTDDNDFIRIVHEEVSDFETTRTLKLMFWLTAAWDEGTITIYAAGEDSRMGSLVTVPYSFSFEPLSLLEGKWTVIVHGKSSATDNWLNVGYGPWNWKTNQTDFFKRISDPTAHETRDPYDAWAWEIAHKLSLTSKGTVDLHRLADRTEFKLETWGDLRNREAGYGEYIYDPNSHHILIFDWDEASDYLDINDPDFDDWFAYASGDALYALAKKFKFDSDINTLIGYSRGGVVCTELARRLCIKGHSDFQAIFLDSEGWLEFVEELPPFDFPIGGLNLIFSSAIRILISGRLPTPLKDWVLNNPSELEMLAEVLIGYMDYKFLAFDGMRADQYRQAYSNLIRAFCGAEKLQEGNDRPVEYWPDFSTVPNYISLSDLQPYHHSPGELCHSHFPHYFADWCFLAKDSRLNKVFLETPQLWNWKTEDGIWDHTTDLEYPTEIPSPPENMKGGVFNGGIEDGSLAGWTYHGGTTPIDTNGINGDRDIEIYKGNYAFQFSHLDLNTLYHNWQVVPDDTKAIKIGVAYNRSIFTDDVLLEFGWSEENGRLFDDVVRARDLTSDYKDIATPLWAQGHVGRIFFDVQDNINWDAFFYVHSVEFLSADPPIINTLHGNPNPVVKGENLVLQANVQKGDNDVAEVVFYHDTNHNQVFDSEFDLVFSYSDDFKGNASSWEAVHTTAGIPIGNNIFFARARDIFGLWSNGEACQLEVIAPKNYPPMISELIKSHNSVPRGENIVLTAIDVSDPDGTVKRVDFYHDANRNAVFDPDIDSLLGTVFSLENGSASAPVNTAELPAGVVRFFAIAYDDQGLASAEVSTRCSIVQNWDLEYHVTPIKAGTIFENPAAGQYADGTLVNPTAQASLNYQFSRWEANGTTISMPYYLTEDTILTGVFEFNGETTIPPIINPIDSQQVIVGNPFSLALTKQQGDEPITWTLESKPSEMTIGTTTGVISWLNPTPEESSHVIVVKAENSVGSDSEGFMLYVAPSTNPDQPILSVNPPVQQVESSAGSSTFTIQNTGTGTMEWNATVTSGESWLSITSDDSGINNGTISVAFTNNPETNSRTGTILISAPGAENSPIEVRVVQEGFENFHCADNGSGSDQPNDGIIGDWELLHAIDVWMAGDLMCEGPFGDFDLLHLIDLWAQP